MSTLSSAKIPQKALDHESLIYLSFGGLGNPVAGWACNPAGPGKGHGLQENHFLLKGQAVKPFPCSHFGTGCIFF